MRRSPLALAAFVVALLATWAGLLLWAACVDLRAPFAPEIVRVLAGDDFHTVFGSATPRDGALHVEAAAEDFSALQASALPHIAADDFPILRYRFGDFPRTLELSLVFRTAEHPDDVHTISLPWPGTATSTFDLSSVPAWRGRIIELGFAQFATAQLVPPERGFAPFDLVEARLWSPSWHGALAALATDWFGAWPWSQRSVHALGRDGDAPRARSIVLLAALAAAAAIGWAALLLGLRGRALATAALVAVGLAWFALDLRWQAGLVHRLQATRTLFAGTEWSERARLVGDSDIAQAADELRAVLAHEWPHARVLVQAGSNYQTLRLNWHLLPLNVGALVLARASGTPLPDNSLLVFYDTDVWYRDPELRKLLAHSRRLVPRGVLHANGFEAESLIVFRYRHAP
ncbi:MAG: hypothetical protein GXC76_11760 [Rhodanobacteraceae bacterium]|jgi:hypothetical protein|nr:hypothetical protein [Rhodanobacteraceae bacterium]